MTEGTAERGESCAKVETEYPEKETEESHRTHDGEGETKG